MHYDEGMNRWQELLTRREMLGGMLGLGLVCVASPAIANVPLPPRKPRPPRLLVLDPGHGGKDPGAIGRNGVLEKTITLDLGLRLANLLRGQEKIQVRLTRETDTFVPLQDRVKFARALGADLFVSIHADSAPNPKARGLSVYSLSDRASDDLTKSLVEQEIKAEPEQKTLPDYVDPEVAAILLDLTTKRTRQLSAGVKERIIRGMTGDWPILTNPIRSANFVVLRAPDVPSVLLESGFLSNTQDATMLASKTQRARLAKELAKEIHRILTGPLYA